MAPTLHIITGQTAVGKTAWAIDFALKNDAEIVSCDSLLVYRGMDIGTAKPDAAERAAVPHHCIDLVEPAEKFSVGDYICAAKNAVDGILSRGKNVVVAGGSGFYLKAFFRAVTDTVFIPPEVPLRVREIEKNGLTALQMALLEFAPERPDFLDWNNPRRVAKALERCLASGKRLAEIHGEFLNATGAFDAFRKHTILLERPPEILAGRIEFRARQMLANGLIDEVRGLLENGKLLPETPAALSVGYRETIAFLREKSNDTDALAGAISLATRQLAAKQKKWFRTQISADEIIQL